VRRGRLELPCLAAPPPQDGVSTNFTTAAGSLGCMYAPFQKVNLIVVQLAQKPLAWPPWRAASHLGPSPHPQHSALELATPARR
jgi:hypothetical protein